MAMADDRVIEGFRKRLAGLYFLRILLFCVTLLAFAGGFAVLVLRLALGRSLDGERELLAAGIAAAAAVVVSAIHTFRTIPTLKTLRVVFDKINQCGGLLMAGSEVTLGPWSSTVGKVSAPVIGWNGRRSVSAFCLAVVFLGVSFAVPQRLITTQANGRLEIGDQARKMEEQIELLKEEHILTEEGAQDIRLDLAKLEETALGREPVKTWEALGHIQDQLKKAADEASVEMLAETEDLAKAEALAEALNQAGDELDGQVIKEAMQELGQRVEALLKDNEALRNAMGGQLADSASAGQLSAEQLRELVKALQGRKAELSARTARLCSADLAKMKLMQMCEKSGACNGKGLAAMLAECGSVQQAMAMYMNNPNWGIDRGRGDAPMVWADPSSSENTKFKEQVLPPATMAALKDSHLAGVSVSAPSAEEGQENLTAGALSGAEAGSGQAIRQKVLPKHKAAVQGYFEREGESNQP